MGADMPPPVGQVLQDARTRRGIDLTEAERVTKIRVKFLRAMEEERWEALPEPVYARGFLSTYARFLELDDEPLLEEYRRTAEGADRVESIPLGAIRAGGLRPRRKPVKPALLAAVGLVTALLLGLVIVGLLESSGDGGKPVRRQASTPTRSGTVATTGEPAASSTVSLDLRSTAAVWVCLVDSGDRALVAETLQTGELRGPFDGKSFEVTFGNGSVEMTVDGQAAKVPAAAEPLGYRITPQGIHRLDPASEPTCA
jgi:hypothetical protein